MSIESSTSVYAATHLMSGLGRPIVGAIGDETVETEVSDFPSFLSCLASLREDLMVSSEAVITLKNGTTADVAALLPKVAKLTPRPHAMLVCVGLEDCRRTTTGTAPTMARSRAALETIADRLLESGTTPVFIIPRPSVMFSNGLFADRFIAIAATMRYLATKPGIMLVDATRDLMKQRAYGVEPDPSLVDANGRLTAVGNKKLAAAVAAALPTIFSSSAASRRPS